MTALKLDAGHIVAERYKIDETIGVGGMAVVYRAHDSKLDRFVTLKVLKEDYLADDDLIARFPEEARAAATLNHQNAVSIFDYGQDGDIYYIVLEYVDGASLKSLINKKSPFDDDTTLAVAIQIAEGIAAAHHSQIIHRDIKPQNILVTTTNIVKVADFGIARAAKSATLTAGAGSMGSVHYFSPEQARGGYLDHKTDIYSLGVCMYEMATGKLPFDGENEVSIALQHINDDFPDITRYNPKVSESIVRIIQKSTAKSASARYQTADEMVQDLKRALTDATGEFVSKSETDVSPTRVISQENREAIRRQKQRNAFLDGVEDEPEGVKPEELPTKDIVKETYTEDDLYPEDFDDEDDYEEEPTYTDRKKSDKLAIVGGVVLGLVFVAIITTIMILLVPRITGGSANVTAPDLTGMSISEAQRTVERYGFVFDISGHEHSDNIPYGYVISQIQTPQFTGLSAGDPVQVIVSLGQIAEYSMPNLMMLTHNDAVAELNSMSINLNIHLAEHHDEAIPRDTVINQEPPIGTLLTEGSTVVLSISLGPDNDFVRVPNLMGKTEAEALEALRDADLRPGQVHNEESTTFAPGTIMHQEPEPHEMTERGGLVEYTLSTGAPAPSPTPTPDPTPTPEPTPTPAPTPTPDATPTPTPTPTPDDSNDLAGVFVDPPATEPPTETIPEPTPPEQTEPQLRQGTLNIALWAVPEGTDTVHIFVTRQDGNASPVPIVNDPNAGVGRFPFPLPIEGSGQSVFRIYSYEDGVRTLRATQPFDFDQ